MKKISLLTLLLFVANILFSQEQVVNVEAENIDESITITWGVEDSSSERKCLYYDDGVYRSNIAAGIYMSWGICFPDTKDYEGMKLTHVTFFDGNCGNDGSATINIYLGGELAPDSLVLSQEVELKQLMQFVDVALESPITLDGTQPLWVTMYSNSVMFPASVCKYNGNPNSNWIKPANMDWGHLYEVFYMEYSWMIRAYVSDERGEKMLLEDRQDEVVSYNIYRTSAETNSYVEVASDVTTLEYVDCEWKELEEGNYRWGVAAVYPDDSNNGNSVETSIVWSDAVEKNTEGVVEKKSAEIRLYPNPVKDVLYVDADEEKDIDIYNVLGIKLMTVSVEQLIDGIDMSGFEPGIYFVEYDNSVYRVVKN